MKFQLPEPSLPSPDKIANSLPATIRININSLMKWVSEYECTGQKPLKTWRPRKEVKLQMSLSDIKKNAREMSRSSEGPRNVHQKLVMSLVQVSVGISQTHVMRGEVGVV